MNVEHAAKETKNEKLSDEKKWRKNIENGRKYNERRRTI